MPSGYKHGLKGTPEYNVWVNMRQRCNNPTGHNVDYYKGITVCPEWDDVTRFVEDMGPRPGMDYQLDRIDNTKGYCKDNCHWVQKIPQMQNTRIAKFWFVNGVRYDSLREAAEAHNTTGTVVKRWCEGRNDSKNPAPPKPGCWSVRKYDLPEFFR